MRATSSHALCQSFLRESEILQKVLIGSGFFNRVEIFPLQIFNQGDFCARGIAQGAHKRRNGIKSCQLRCTEAALPCDEFIPLPGRKLPDQDRLQNAMLNDGFFKLFQSTLIKFLARLIAIGLYIRHRNLLHNDTILHLFWYQIIFCITFCRVLQTLLSLFRFLFFCTFFFHRLRFHNFTCFFIGIRILQSFFLRCFCYFHFCGKERTQPLAQCLMLPSCHALRPPLPIPYRQWRPCSSCHRRRSAVHTTVPRSSARCAV